MRWTDDYEVEEESLPVQNVFVEAGFRGVSCQFDQRIPTSIPCTLGYFGLVSFSDGGIFPIERIGETFSFGPKELRLAK